MGCVQLPVFAPGWSLISPKQECESCSPQSLELAWEIWSLYTLSGPARWSRQQSSCLRLFPPGSFVDLHLDGSLAYTSKLANSAAESPTREGRHAPINYKPLSHGYQTWKASPNRKKEKCNLFGRVLYTNMQVEWLSNTINRLCQLPQQVRPRTIDHKLFKH